VQLQLFIDIVSLAMQCLYNLVLEESCFVYCLALKTEVVIALTSGVLYYSKLMFKEAWKVNLMNFFAEDLCP